MPNEITIELYPAGNGDAMLLDFGTQLILIDGGYTSTFRDYLKPRLKELHNAGRSLSKFVVTHIDADHISGAIAFIKDNGPAANPSIITIDEIWFNSYRHLFFKDKEDGVFEEGLPAIKILGGLESVETDDENRLVSYPQGTSLGSLILKHNYNWNTTFKGLAVKADIPVEINLDPKIKLTLLGPTQQSLDNMADSWYTYLRKIFKGKINEDTFFDDAFELMMEEIRQANIEASTAFDQEALVSGGGDWVAENAVEWEVEDNSPTNGSSITFLIEFDGKKMLFLGDAIPGQVVIQLKKLIPEVQFPLYVDVLKVSHHGAWSNNSPDLINMIRANYYLFSSNGLRHHHPHMATLAGVLKSHGTESFKTLVFNYKQDDRLFEIDNSELKKVYNYGVKWPDVDKYGNGKDGYVKLKIV